MAMSIKPIAGKIGAEIQGIRLNDNLSDADFQALYQALLKYKAIFVNDPELDDRRQEAFAQRLGHLIPHPTVHSAADTAAILDVDSRQSRSKSWHTDITFVADYPKITMLRAAVVPERGGDTVFANTAAAYADLPEPLKQLAGQLWALHTNLYDYAAAQDIPNEDRTRYRTEFTQETYETEHPLVHVHPETGEPSLILGHFVKKILGVGNNDSKLLIRLFHDHITRLDHTVRWRWRAGDLAIWDNRATQHIAVDDYGGELRIMRRSTVAGQVPVSLDGRSSRAIKPSPESRAPRSEAEKKHQAA